MMKLYVKAATFLRSEEGATAVEYGIMVAAIAAVIVGIVFTLGGQVTAAFDKVVNTIDASAGL